MFRDIDEAGFGKKRDKITDFNSERDLIDLSAIDASELRENDQAFSFTGDERFTGASGELKFKDEILRGDVDGDGRADFEIAVLDVTRLNESDLLL